MARWQKGQSGNLKGRPSGSKGKMTLALRAAIKQVEKERGKNLFKHFVDRAYEDNKVLVALIKKLVSAKHDVEALLDGDLKITIVSAVPRPEDED